MSVSWTILAIVETKWGKLNSADVLIYVRIWSTLQEVIKTISVFSLTIEGNELIFTFVFRDEAQYLESESASTLNRYYNSIGHVKKELKQK